MVKRVYTNLNISAGDFTDQERNALEMNSNNMKKTIVKIVKKYIAVSKLNDYGVKSLTRKEKTEAQMEALINGYMKGRLFFTNSYRDQVLLSELYDDYFAYCLSVKDNPLTKQEVRKYIEEELDVPYMPSGGNKRVFRGIKLSLFLEPNEDDWEDDEEWA